MLKEHGRFDILVNNAGRSIRRASLNSFDRFHDFERTMQLNYFGSLRLIMGFMPTMIEQGAATSSTSPRSACWPTRRASRPTSPRRPRSTRSRAARRRVLDKSIRFTTINMPLVKTPMIAPTKMYDQRADADARRGRRPGGQGDHRPAEAHRHAPGHLRRGARTRSRRSYEDRDEHRLPHVPGFGAAAKARKARREAAVELSPEQMAFAQITQGIHW